MTISRRNLLKASSAGLLGAAAVPAIAEKKKPEPVVDAVNKALLGVDRRAEQAYIRRVKAAGNQVLAVVGQGPQPTNGDVEALDGFVGSFSKCLPHDDLGQVDPSAFQALLDGMAADDVSSVPLAVGAERKLANPTAAGTFELHGSDSHTTRIAASPALQTAFAAGEMIEVYWQALTRDVNYDEYATSPLVADAIADMNAASVTIGPTESGAVTPATIFRGSTPGDLVGPYISQFLWQPIKYGAGTIVQRYPQPVPGNDFMTDFDSYLAIQNGRNPTSGDVFEDVPRYIQKARDLANYVHTDVLFQAYYNATMIIFGYGGAAQAQENALLGNPAEGGFVTFGGPDVLNMVAQAARMSLTGAWFQKWLQLKLRPEAYGARVDVQRRGLADYGLHPDVMVSEAVARLVSQQGNALLPQAFPEGSPTHPAYPAGHATIAGACTTVMKAVVDEDFVIPNPVVPSADGTTLVPYEGPALTLGGEINKLANNISIGRNAAGVHYRTDGEEGMLAGEQQAIGLLADYSAAYNLDFEGFRFRRFDGTPVLIANGRVTLG